MSVGVRGVRAPAWLIACTALVSVGSAGGALAIVHAWLADSRAASTEHPLASTIAPHAAAPSIAPSPRTEHAPTPPPSRSAAASRIDCEASVEVYFEYARATPPDNIATTLAPIVAYADAHPDAKVVVDGHADLSGDDVGNLRLSKQRAMRVADHLSKLGVPRDRIVQRAFGAYVPVVGNPSSELRRVQVSIRDARCGEEERP